MKIKEYLLKESRTSSIAVRAIKNKADKISDEIKDIKKLSKNLPPYIINMVDDLEKQTRDLKNKIRLELENEIF